MTKYERAIHDLLHSVRITMKRHNRTAMAGSPVECGAPVNRNGPALEPNIRAVCIQLDVGRLDEDTQWERVCELVRELALGLDRIEAQLVTYSFLRGWANKSSPCPAILVALVRRPRFGPRNWLWPRWCAELDEEAQRLWEVYHVPEAITYRLLARMG